MAGGGLAAAALAVLASSCCGIPLALAAIGVSGAAIGLLGPLPPLRPIILAVTALILLTGWLFAVRWRSKRSYPVLIVASILFLIALLAPIWELQLTHWMTRIHR